MLEQQNALMEALQHLGVLEISALLMVVILLSVWLVVRARGRKSVQEVPVIQRNVVSENTPAPAQKDVDSPVLSSTVDSIVAATSANSVESSIVSAIPEDSVLRRHYLANVEAQKRAQTEPYPSDSVLHRHYDASHTLHLDGEPVVLAAQHVVKVEQASIFTQPKIPQESVLKRHFIAQLQAEVEAYLAPRPSDSVLLRHYQTLVAAELEQRLSGFKA